MLSTMTPCRLLEAEERSQAAWTLADRSLDQWEHDHESNLWLAGLWEVEICYSSETESLNDLRFMAGKRGHGVRPPPTFILSEVTALSALSGLD